MPTAGGSRKLEPELDLLSNIVRAFNEQFGTHFSDADRILHRISEDIVLKVTADSAVQNAAKSLDCQNARIEHDTARCRVVLGLPKDATERFKQVSDPPLFKCWRADLIFR